MSRFPTPIDRNIFSANIFVTHKCAPKFSTLLTEIFRSLIQYSIFSCKYYYLWVRLGGYVKVKIDLSSSGFEPTTSDTRIPRSTHYSRLLQRMFEKKLKISQTKPKKKIPVYVLNYFSGQKGVQEKYLHMVVKIKPVYWLKRKQHMAG